MKGKSLEYGKIGAKIRDLRRYEYGDYIKYRNGDGFIIGKILESKPVNMYFENYTIEVILQRSKIKYATVFTFGGDCVENSEKISELEAVTLGL